jgi:hypothetical protein
MVRDSDDDDAIPWETRQGLGRSLETQVEGLTGMISNDEQLNDQEEGLAEILNRSLADLLPDLRNMGRNLGRPAPAAPQPAPAPAPATPRHAPPRHSPPPPLRRATPPLVTAPRPRPTSHGPMPPPAGWRSTCDCRKACRQKRRDSQ